MSDQKYASLRGFPPPRISPRSEPDREAPAISSSRTGPHYPALRPTSSRVSASSSLVGQNNATLPAYEEIPESKELLPTYRHSEKRRDSWRSFFTLDRHSAASLRLARLALGLFTFAYVLHALYSAHEHVSGRWTGSEGGQRHKWQSPKTNVILMISDGYGPAGETFARSFAAALNGSNPSDPYSIPTPLPLDDLLIGTHRSRSSSSLITDSAAGATAFACGVKSYNSAIGVDSKGSKCGTLFEAAKSQLGMLTGVVVTSRLTDATPAAFVSHASSRALEADIASQEVVGTIRSKSKGRDTDRILDLAVGGGGCNFMRKGHPLSCREDDVDLVQDALELGWDVWAAWPINATTESAIVSGQLPRMQAMVENHALIQSGYSLPGTFAEDYSGLFRGVSNTQAVSQSKSKLPYLALLAPINTPYEIDRISIEETKRPPSLKHLATQALHMLDADVTNDKGFILMIEGSQIDLCAHSNDGACHAREILAYQETIATVRKFVDEKNAAGERTILVSTSDHETGGLTLGRQLTKAYPNYAWYPERLLEAKQSAQMLSAGLIAYTSTAERSLEEVDAFIRQETLGDTGAGFGPKTGGEPTDEEVAMVRVCLKTDGAAAMQDPPIDVRDVCRAQIAETMSRRAEIGWSTTGHTGVDINVYAYGPGTDALRGNIENTDVGNTA